MSSCRPPPISAALVGALWPLSYFAVTQWALFFSLILIAVACIIMGAGIPTTATYIILVAVAAPALAQLGVQPLVVAFLRLLLRRAGRHHAAGGAGRLCGCRDRRIEPVPDRKHGVPARHRQGAGAVRLRLFAVAAAGRQGLHLERSWSRWPGPCSASACIGAAFSGYLLAPLQMMERWWVGIVVAAVHRARPEHDGDRLRAALACCFFATGGLQAETAILSVRSANRA